MTEELRAILEMIAGAGEGAEALIYTYLFLEQLDLLLVSAIIVLVYKLAKKFVAREDERTTREEYTRRLFSAVDKSPSDLWCDEIANAMEQHLRDYKVVGMGQDKSLMKRREGE